MTFTTPTEVAVIKSKLESEGIECKVLDEHTVQVYNFLSHAIGGVRLQVEESNLKKARIILEENGLIQKDNQPKQSKTERVISNPKFQKKIKFSFISMVTIILISALFLFVYRYLNRPTTLELLTKKDWCVEYIVYQNQEYIPNTTSDEVQIRFMGECYEKLDFDISGNVNFPGFNSTRINGKWKLDNNLIKVSQIDTLDFLLERKYEYKINRTELILDSDSLTIYCSSIINGYY